MNRTPCRICRICRPWRTALLALALAAGLARANDQIPPPAQQRPLLVTGATLHPVDGPDIADGRMLVMAGRIVALGGPDAAFAVPADAQRLHLPGKHVYPGFIAANSALGLTEVGSVRATVDTTETGALNPNARALVAVNADSELLPVARSNGVLAALVVPRGGPGALIAGTSALVQLDGWSWADMALLPAVGLHVMPPTLRLSPDQLPAALVPRAEELRRVATERLRRIDEAFASAAAYQRARAADPQAPADIRLQAMQGAIDGTQPVFVHADELAQIRWAIDLAQRHRLRLVIVGGQDSARLAPLLRARDVAVVIGGVHRLPLRRDDAYDSAFTLAAQLAQAGVRFAIARDGSEFAAAHERDLPYEAGTAVAHGLSPAEALKAITLYPAQILGVADRLGALAPGRLGSFIVTDGDPLQITTRIERLFVQGREVDADNRQLRLQRKYQQRLEQLGTIAPAAAR
jgi:imidazolonepropionase-like amidohydrolase